MADRPQNLTQLDQTDGPAGFIHKGYVIGFMLVTSLFFLWAVANNFNDILIRQFQKALDLNRAQAGLIQSVFYFGYFLIPLPAGMIIKRFGYRAGILTGLCLYALGALLFFPAAEVRQFAFFLGALFIIAAGAAFLETAANPYIVAFGDSRRAPQRLNLAQSFNGLGAVIAPIIGGMFIFSGVEHSKAELNAMSAQDLIAFRISEAKTVQLPYLCLAGVVLLVALAVAFVKLPKVQDAQLATEQNVGKIRMAGLFAAVVAQFFYVGAQVGIWSFFVDFVKDMLPAVPEKTAAYLLSGSLALFMLGRFIGTALMHRIRAEILLKWFAFANVLLCLIVVFAPPVVAVSALGLTSFFMSIMFPTIFALGVRDLGPRTATGSSLIIMAIIGGALFPPLMGLIGQAVGGMKLAFLLPLLCFAVIAFYAMGATRRA